MTKSDNSFLVTLFDFLQKNAAALLPKPKLVPAKVPSNNNKVQSLLKQKK
jgi:hypothetical protein